MPSNISPSPTISTTQTPTTFTSPSTTSYHDASDTTYIQNESITTTSQPILSHRFLISTLMIMGFILCCLVILCVGILNIKRATTKKKILQNNITKTTDEQCETGNTLNMTRNDKVKRHYYKERKIDLNLSVSRASKSKSKSPFSDMLSGSVHISIPTSLNVEHSCSKSDTDDIVEVTEQENQNVISIDDIHADKIIKYDEYLTPTELSRKQHKISCELNLILPDDHMDNSIMTGVEDRNLTHSRNNFSVTTTNLTHSRRNNTSHCLNNLSITRTYNSNNILNV